MKNLKKINTFSNLISKLFFKKEPNGEKRLKKEFYIALGVLFVTFIGTIQLVRVLQKSSIPKVSENSLSDAQSQAHEMTSDEETAQKAKALATEISQRQNRKDLVSRLFSHGGSSLTGSGDSMIIERKDKVVNVETTLPRGTLLLAKLLNTIVSNNTNSPVVAKVMRDHVHLGQVLIPKESTLIGQAQQDNNPKRVMVTFDTIVFPAKTQVSFTATALNPDGSSGLTGQYYSGRGQEIFGSLLSAAISGFAQGSQTTEVTPYGTEVKRGSLQNAIWEGVSQSALEQAKRFAQEIEKAKGYVVVPQEAQILVFLDQQLNLEEVAFEY